MQGFSLFGKQPVATASAFQKDSALLPRFVDVLFSFLSYADLSTSSPS
jgi:hypothetical protein